MNPISPESPHPVAFRAGATSAENATSQFTGALAPGAPVPGKVESGERRVERDALVSSQLSTQTPLNAPVDFPARVAAGELPTPALRQGPNAEPFLAESSLRTQETNEATRAFQFESRAESPESSARWHAQALDPRASAFDQSSERAMLGGEIPSGSDHGRWIRPLAEPSIQARTEAHETAARKSPDSKVAANWRSPHLENGGSHQFAATDAEHLEAQQKETLCHEFARLTNPPPHGGGYSLNEAAQILGKSPSWFSGANSPFARWNREGIAGLLPRRGASGAKPRVFPVAANWCSPDSEDGGSRQRAATDSPELPAWFIPACKFFYRHLNRTAEAGSVPEAIRRAISMPQSLEHLPHLKPKLAAYLGIEAKPTRSALAVQAFEFPICPPALREAILAREREGKDLLPERLSRQIAASAPEMRAIRSPRDAWLRYVESPGSLMLTIDEDGIERFLEPGEWWTIDDGTINLCCTVPLARPGDKCFDKFGVLVGRFQFLLVVDHRSYFITGFSYTARPRSSYRGEDLNATMHTAFTEHGRPRAMVLENGISAARIVSEALGLCRVGILRARSPHQKVVEGVFNKLWTKLSLERGQVGRFRGEEQETNRLLESCRQGHTDPRRHFLPLEEILRALRQAIAEHNSGLVNGRYGRWVPSEYFAAHAAKHLRPIEPDSAWVFSPVVAGPLKVRTMCLKTSVPLLPGFSQSFAFANEELVRWHGARVKLYFNPLAPDCVAKIVLAEPWRGERAGTVIGDALQIDRQARFTRRLLGYGLDPDIGLLATRQNALALRRVAQAVRPDGRAAEPVTEQRDGREATTLGVLTDSQRIRHGKPATAANVRRLADLAEDDPLLRPFVTG